MRKRWLGALTVLTVAGAGTLAAQGPGGGMMRGGGLLAVPQIDSLKARLGLDAEQVAKITPLLAKFEEETKQARETIQRNMQRMREGTATDETRGESMAAMTFIREHADSLYKQIRDLLKPSQHQAFDEWVASRQPRRPGGGPPLR